jgi:hypothetical protein
MDDTGAHGRCGSCGDFPMVAGMLCGQVDRVAMAVLLAACGGLSACTAQRVKMYQETELPAERTATIAGAFDRLGMMVTLERIDGAVVPNQGPIRGGIYSRQTTAVVQPGVHIVEIRFWGSNGSVEQFEPYPVTFLTEAGHQYEIRIERDPMDPDTFMSSMRKTLSGGRESWVTYVFDLSGGTAVPIQNSCEGPTEQMSAMPIRRDLRVAPQPIVVVIY